MTDRIKLQAEANDTLILATDTLVENVLFRKYFPNVPLNPTIDSLEPIDTHLVQLIGFPDYEVGADWPNTLWTKLDTLKLLAGPYGFTVYMMLRTKAGLK